MGKRGSRRLRGWLRASGTSLLLAMVILGSLLSSLLPVLPQTSPGVISPTQYPLLFGSPQGTVRIDIPKRGIAVRVEIPRQFLPGVAENDTHFLLSNITNDYYYYSVVDEARHWVYDWKGTNSNGDPQPSDGPCYKPDFSLYDQNAPYCVEIWNYLNYPKFYSPNPSADYCSLATQEYVFGCFNLPKFVLLHGLTAPPLAGVYNFTLFVANRTNTLGYPDFVHAWSRTLFVPVSMSYNPVSIPGQICEQAAIGQNTCSGHEILAKGIVYAERMDTDQVVARAYVNETICKGGEPRCSGPGSFNITGLDPGSPTKPISYLIEGSAGVNAFNGFAYSLTPYSSNITCAGSCSSGGLRLSGGITLFLSRAPIVQGTITYTKGSIASTTPIRSLSDDPYLIAAGFRFLNVTVEGTDPTGHIFRFRGVSSNTIAGDSFNLTTGVGVKYVGESSQSLLAGDPYGTEFAGLPAPGSGGYSINVTAFVSGYFQSSSQGQTVTCSPAEPFEQPTCTAASIILTQGGVIAGKLQFEDTAGGLESPHQAASFLSGSPLRDKVFGGNVIIEAYDSNNILRGVTVINGTLPNGDTSYARRTSLRFYIIGFSEYYNRTLSGPWYCPQSQIQYQYHCPDYGLYNDQQYTLQVFVRGYNLTSTTPKKIGPLGGGLHSVTAHLTVGGVFEITVSSFDDIFGTRSLAGTPEPAQSFFGCPSCSGSPTQSALPWRFMNSSIPVRARVYIYDCNNHVVGYVEMQMANASAGKEHLRPPNSQLSGVLSLSLESFQVVFAGQNWSLREIWFYGLVPTFVGNAVYNIRAYTLGYVDQFPCGISVSNTLGGIASISVILFVGNEADITLSLSNSGVLLPNTLENDYSIGQVFSTGLTGAEMANLASRAPTPIMFTVFGFGAMELSNFGKFVCQTILFNNTRVGSLKQTVNLCGQGHFFYESPPLGGTYLYFDYGLDMGNYTAEVPEFGFNIHFMQYTPVKALYFPDLFLEGGVVYDTWRMGEIYGVVSGYTDLCTSSGGCPLSWARVTAATTNASYSYTATTLDGTFDGVDALFVPGLPGGQDYNVTVTDVSGVDYQSQSFLVPVAWGGSAGITAVLCPIGQSCPTAG